MRVWTILLVSAILFMAAAAASAEMVMGQATSVSHPMLSVSGTGTVQVAPDTVRITASVITEGDTVETARERNAQTMQKLMDAVKTLKLANVTMRTLNYTLERVTSEASVAIKVDLSKLNLPWKIGPSDLAESNFRIGVPVTLGFRASNSLTVRMTGTREELSEGGGKIIDALMAAGANQITSFAYSLEKDNTAAMREALTKAVKDAQMTAEAVAAAAGRKIVGLRNISPSYMRPMPEMRQAAYAGVAVYSAPATPTPVTAGMLEVSATVQVNYELDYNPGDTQFLPSPSGK